MSRWHKKGQKKTLSASKAGRLNPKEVEMRKKEEPAWAARERRQESRINEEDKVVIELLTNGQTPEDKSVINALT
jgi:hypothetical protein